MATSHLSGPAVVYPPASLYRVVRRGRELDHSRINAADAALTRSGNRFDVAGGGVPQDWRARRLMIEAATIDPLPFVDVEDPDTHEFVTSAMAPQLARWA